LITQYSSNQGRNNKQEDEVAKETNVEEKCVYQEQLVNKLRTAEAFPLTLGELVEKTMKTIRVNENGFPDAVCYFDEQSSDTMI